MTKITIPVAAPQKILEETKDIVLKSSVLELENRQLRDLLSEKDRQLAVLMEELSELKEKLQEIDSIREEEESVGELLLYLLQDIRDSMETAFHGFTSEMADILFVSLAKILGNVLVEKDIALSVIRNVIAHENILDILQVRVSTRDFELINGYSKFEDLKVLQFVPDPAVETGGCILQLRSGLVDGRVDVQLKSLNDLMRMAIY